MNKLFFCIIILTTMLGCDSSNPPKKKINNDKLYELLNQNDGGLTILEKREGKIYYINKSHRIYDLVDLNIEDSLSNIISFNRRQKDNQYHYKYWNDKTINKKYTISMETRFFNDKMLYKIKLSPYDESLSYKSSTITIYLTDSQNFLLFDFTPDNWSRTVDENGNPQYYSSYGQIPMKIDDYFQVKSYLFTYQF